MSEVRDYHNLCYIENNAFCLLFLMTFLAPGRIITAPGEAMPQLTQQVEFNCTVYGNTFPEISWYGLDGELLEDVAGKIEIEETLNSTLYTTSLLRILDVARVDNGTYTCNATNTVTQNADVLSGDSGEYYLIVIGKLIYQCIACLSSNLLVFLLAIFFFFSLQQSCEVRFKVVVFFLETLIYPNYQNFCR